MSESYKIIVLTSGQGRGSNLQAMHEFFLRNDLPVEIACTVVVREDAPVVDRCRRLDIPTVCIPLKPLHDYESALSVLVQREKPSLIALAGFLQRLSPAFLKNCPCPIVNIHPALLPRYGGKGMYGHHVHEAVYQAGDFVSGATVHYVSEWYDEGEIIAQEQVDITDCNSPEEIALKVLGVEHRLYGATIWKVLTQST